MEIINNNLIFLPLSVRISYNEVHCLCYPKNQLTLQMSLTMELHMFCGTLGMCSGVPRGGRFGGFNPPPEIPKALRNRAKFNPILKSVKNCRIYDANTPRCSEKGSKILKLPPVRNCFTLAKTNKLVVITNGLKVPNIKKILLYEMKCIVPNYSCLQKP